MLPDDILRKKGLRNERFWTREYIYRYLWIRKIPAWFDTWALLKSQYWPRGKLELLQDDRIRSLLPDASRIPFWQNTFVDAGIDMSGTLDRTTLARIPLTSKKDFLDLSLEEFTDTVRNPYFYRDCTSGSTGRPFEFFQDIHSELSLYGANERMIRTAGHGTRCHFITIRGHWQPGLLLANATYFYLRGYSSLQDRLSALQELIVSKRSKGIVLQVFSSTLLRLAQIVEDQGLQLHLRAVIAMGEGLSEKQRTYIERVLGTELFMTYGTNEIGRIGFECEHHRMHINEERLYIEITDGEGNRLPAGKEGKIIFTTFDNRVMPFIRYDAGDRGIIDGMSCPCGRTLRTIRFTGRSAEIIELPGERQVSLLHIAAAFDIYWNVVRQFQIVQHDPASFVIKVIPGPFFKEAHDKLEERLIRLLHPSVHITWDIVESIPEGPSGKAVYFVRAVKPL